LKRKIKHIRSTHCEVVATGNPGCLLQILNGAKKEGLPLRIVHPITLLAEAYRRVSLSPQRGEGRGGQRREG
ncbi:MAG TPA: (Fe-S)-binding protein, partial [Candidatus Dormibacteraeota bacterium]|nr:(Fe-S)-binding protein [Candidatus Dormibacteraeota bacterium]